MFCETESHHQENEDLQHLKTSLEKLYVSSNDLNKPDKVLHSKSHDTELLILKNDEKALLDLVNNEINLVLKLEKLNISFCNLLKIPNAIWKLKYLMHLNLSHNSLENIPEEIKFLQNLATLDVSYNKLTCLPKSLRLNHQLTILNLRCNNFSEVPLVMYFGLRKIKILDMSFNALSKFDEPPEFLSNIIEARLSNNLLERLPCWIFNSICQLQVLDVSNNSMTFFPEYDINYYWSGIFETLKVLKIENCNFTNERLNFLYNFKNLEIILMGNKEETNKCNPGKNYLGNLKMNIFRNIKKVNELHLQNAQISCLPKDFDCLKNIVFLNLLGNMLSWLPENFCNLVQLRVLNLSSNQLSFLPNDIHCLVNLQRIHLDNNNLCELPETFYKLSNLEFIDLYNNKLEEFDLEVFMRKKLIGIDLGLNCIEFNLLGDSSGNRIIEQYNLLKINFRKYFDFESTRSDLQLTKTYGKFDEPNESSGSTAELSDFLYEDMSSDDEKINYVIKTDQKNDDENDWEKVSSHEMEEDDLYDPNGTDIFHKRPTDAIWNTDFQNNYCPSNVHVQPVMNIHFKKDKLISKAEFVEEGQFDSD